VGSRLDARPEGRVARQLVRAEICGSSVSHVGSTVAIIALRSMNYLLDYDRRFLTISVAGLNSEQ